MKMSDKIKDPTNISALQDLARGVNSDIGRWIAFMWQRTGFSAGIWPLKKRFCAQRPIRTTLAFFIIPLGNRQATRRRWQHSKI